jgi:hypothetical protein
MPVTRSKRPGIPHRARGGVRKGRSSPERMLLHERLLDPSVVCMTSAGRVAQRAELDDLSTKALSAKFSSVPISALPASVCDRKRSISGFRGHDRHGLGMPESAPCSPDSCRFCEPGGRVIGARSARAAAPQAPLTRGSGSGSCRAAGAGGPLVVRVGVQRFRLVAFLCGVIGRDGRGRGGEQPALPRSAGRGQRPRRHDD